MASNKVRKKIRHDDETRSKIQAAQIINRLTSCLMGGVELTQAQVTCGKILLNKVLPDLSSVQMSADVETKVTHATKEQRDAAFAAALRAKS